MPGKYDLVVMGASAGGYDAFRQILSGLESEFPLPIAVVQHLAPESGDYMIRNYKSISALDVREVEEKEPVVSGCVYFAPPNYHILIETNRTFSLSIDPKVNFSRPSIDVLFDSASEVYGPRLIGVLLTGANADGAAGLKKIHNKGGVTLVQDPETAEVPVMPRAALDLFPVKYTVPLERIAPFLSKLTKE